MSVDLLLCIATEGEGALLRQRFKGADASIAIVRMGVGAVNAAHAVTLFLSKTGANAIVMCGVGGAYPASGLSLGQVVCAESECYGDLGASSPTGFLDMKALGFPTVELPTPLFNELPMQIFPTERRARFVTVSTCTGIDADARALEARTGGAVETMEGAAVAHVAHLHGIPVGEVRGISNIVTNRDKSSWQLRAASEAAQKAVLTWIDRR
jgi:futalosine hydrolase